MKNSPTATWETFDERMLYLLMCSSTSATERSFKGAISPPSCALGKRYLAHAVCLGLLQRLISVQIRKWQSTFQTTSTNSCPYQADRAFSFDDSGDRSS